jgi:FKBP-type peptidyl-prolyl cis-trans isomerase 2
MAIIKQNDFVSVEYNGYIKDSNTLFDTTDQKLAQKHNLKSQSATYGHIIIAVGHQHILKGIDDHLLGKETGKKYEIELKPEDAFGKKDTRLLRLVPNSIFKKQGIQPFPGLEINVDGLYGIVKTTGGRVIVDFNHPLSGKEVRYEVKVGELVTDDTEKIKAVLKVMLNEIPSEIKLEDGKANMTLPDQLPKEIADELVKQIKELVPSVKELIFQAAAKPESHP